MTPTLKEFPNAKYAHVVAALERDIQNGALAPNDRLPSFSEMRARFAVNSYALDRVYRELEQRGLITREPRRGIFVANPQGRAATHVIGVSGIYPRLQRSFYYSHVIEGVREAAARDGRDVLLINDASAISWEKVDGVLIFDRDPLPFLPPLIPCVSVLVSHEEMSSVITDDREGARTATEHLLALGHRRIAYLTSQGEIYGKQRVAGYQDALREAGIAPRASWIRKLPAQFDISYPAIGYEMMQLWLKESWPKLGCTALLTPNDEAAIGVIKALREAGLAVPEQISVVGFDGTEISEHVSPALTTVEVPLREIGVAAMEVLLKLMAGGKSRDENITLPVSLKARDSTAKPGRQ